MPTIPDLQHFTSQGSDNMQATCISMLVGLTFIVTIHTCIYSVCRYYWWISSLSLVLSNCAAMSVTHQAHHTGCCMRTCSNLYYSLHYFMLVSFLILHIVSTARLYMNEVLSTRIHTSIQLVLLFAIRPHQVISMFRITVHVPF